MPAKKIEGISEKIASVAVAACRSGPAGTSKAIGISLESIIAIKSKKIKYGLYG
jgi:hypothetical protein